MCDNGAPALFKDHESPVIEVALYRPEIAQNTAAILRTAACFDAAVHIIGPASFDLSDRAVRRAGMDYVDAARIKRHHSFEAFAAAATGRIVLLTTRGPTTLNGFAFRQSDILLYGQESSGVPDSIHAAADARLSIPMAKDARSLNLAVAVAVGLWQACISTNRFPG